MTDFIERVSKPPPDATFGISALARADQDPNRINLSVGAYRDEEGNPWILPCVKQAEEIISASPMNKEYLPMSGDREFCHLAAEVLFGTDSNVLKENRVACVQSLSGTGALRLAAEFLKKWSNAETAYVTNPTWGNHNNIFGTVGFQVESFTYYKASTRGFDIESAISDLSAAKDGQIILFHTCAHNPTGVDPSREEWERLEKVVASKKHICIFDTAYQGYATGDLDNDAFSLRYFVSKGHKIISCQSFSKSLGLYGERVGTCSVVCANEDTAATVTQVLGKLARVLYSNPPMHGMLIVKNVLSKDKLRKQWEQDIKLMSGRIMKMRKMLRKALEDNGTPGDWSHITNQIGMFSFTGLSENHVKLLRQRHHIYMIDNGRISMASLNENNVHRFANAVCDVVKNPN